jgi:hypothetical protein
MADGIHIAEDDTPMLDGYLYNSVGVGVRGDLVEAVLKAWASIDPYGDPAGPLRIVNNGHINKVENLARIAAAAVAGALGAQDQEANHD